MKNVFQKLLIVSMLTVLVACPTEVKPLTPKPPFVSPPGTVTGAPVTKTVDATGGTLSSVDGGIMLEIPAGTFSSATQVSVQAVTNPDAPWGEGTGFRLDGLENQLKPVTVRLKFADNPPAEWIGVAVQDTLGAWRGFRHLTMNEGTKTMNVTLNPDTKTRASTRKLSKLNIFQYSHVHVIPEKTSVKVNATKDFTLELCKLIDKTDPNDDLSPLVKPEPSDCERIGPEKGLQTWTVNGVPNGNKTFGKIIADPIGATFTAPASVPSSNPVQVAVTVHPDGTKTLIAFANVTILGSGFKVVGKFSALGYPVCPAYMGLADVTDQADFLLAETGSATGFPYVVQVLDNKMTKSENFHASEIAAGGTVRQDSASEVFNVLDGNGEFKDGSETLDVTLNGLTWTGGCTLSYSAGGLIYAFPAGESVKSGVSFEFKTNAFVNNTQTVKSEGGSGFGSWEFTITKQ